MDKITKTIAEMMCIAADCLKTLQPTGEEVESD